MNPDVTPVDPPDPAPPASAGDAWWHARAANLESQRQAYADELAARDATVDGLYRKIEDLNDAIAGQSARLRVAGDVNARLLVELARAREAIADLESGLALHRAVGDRLAASLRMGGAGDTPFEEFA